MFQFKRISTTLGVVYAGLFMLVMLVLSGITYAVVTKQAEKIVSEGMIASSSVFTRLFVDQAADIQADASLLAKDFGFRSAVSSGDEPTIVSALQTLRERLHVESLTFVDIDGLPQGQDGAALPIDALSSMISDGYENPGLFAEPGIVFVDDNAVLVGVTPVRAPDIIGWVVFGDFIDAADIADLEALAPIRLKASISNAEASARAPKKLQVIDGQFSLDQEIPSLAPGATAILTLTYPTATAFAPYYVLLSTLAFLILAGVAAVSVASWGLASRLTRPISALVEATEQVRRGELATVDVSSNDELARLAVDFNHMSSEIRERENFIRQSARIDGQTNFPNRRAMEERLASAEDENVPAFVASIQIERFPEIRGTIGFEAAGHLVQSVAEKLSENDDARFVSVVSDGLMSVLVHAEEKENAQELIRSMMAAVQTTFLVSGSCVDIMVRAGVSEISQKEPGIAIKHSIIAAEQAKAASADLQFFDPEKYETTRNNLSLMGDLVKALDDRVVTVAYQPKYDLRSRLPIGVEALVRWKDPVRGQVFPDIFIPLAEETGHIEALTQYVLERSLSAQAQLKKHGYDLCMSINLSGRLVGNDRFAAAIAPMLKKRCGDVCFEITETAVIEDPERGIASIENYVNDGIQISIDDYGSGLSSLAYLKRIPASELKIDKCFVLKIDQDQRDALLVRSTIDLAHSLGMKVTAEGVETNTAAALLAGMGCDVGQGYGLGRPMPIDDLIGFLDAEKSEPMNDEAKAI